jgi:hypothetical protein
MTTYKMYVVQKRFRTVTVDYEDVADWHERGEATYDDIDEPEQMVPDFIEDFLYVDPDDLGSSRDCYSEEGGPTEIEIVGGLMNANCLPIDDLVPA